MPLYKLIPYFTQISDYIILVFSSAYKLHYLKNKENIINDYIQ